MSNSLTIDDLRTKSTFSEIRKAIRTIGESVTIENASIDDWPEDVRNATIVYGSIPIVLHARTCERLAKGGNFR